MSTHPFFTADVVQDADSASVHHCAQEVVVPVVARREEDAVLFARLEAERDVVGVRAQPGPEADAQVIVPVKRHDLSLCKARDIQCVNSRTLSSYLPSTLRHKLLLHKRDLSIHHALGTRPDS